MPKKRIAIIVSIILFTAVATATVFGVLASLREKEGLILFLDGKELCIIESRSDFDKICGEFDKFSGNFKLESHSALTCEYGKSKLKKLDSEKASELLYKTVYSGYVIGYAVKCNGTEVVVCVSHSVAEKCIDALKSSALETLSDVMPDKEITINDRFEIECVPALRSAVLTFDDVIKTVINKSETIDTKGLENVVYGYSSQGVYNRLLSDYGMPKSDKEYADFASLTYGNTNVRISYSTVSETTFTEITDFDVEYTPNKKLYVGETQIYKPGENGISEKTVRTVTSIDGEITRTVVNEKVIVSPKTQLEYKGTKTYPSTKPTGTFIFPIQTYYTISSYYAERRGKLDKGNGPHKGIDIALASGNNVYAADGGEVIVSDFDKNGYGNYVVIQHEEGVVSYYAHMSENKVNVGDYIYKGQIIGLVGMTGHATGPHLHFEVRINGKTVDPLKYLP